MTSRGLSKADAERIKEINKIFDTSQMVYKDLQHLYIKVGNRIHNEYRYCARAQSKIIKAVLDAKFDKDFSDALENYSTGSKHALNDCLDLVYMFAKRHVQILSDICNYTSIGDVYSEFDSVSAILRKYEAIVRLSRAERGTKRIEAYIKMAEEGEYEVLNKFCLNVEEIKKSLNKARKQEINASRKYALTLFVSISILVVGLMALIKGIDWSGFFPNLFGKSKT